jgi:hypothetical protein
MYDLCNPAILRHTRTPIRYTDGDEDDMHLEQYIEAWNLWASISSLGLAQPLKVGDEIFVDW